VINGTGLKVCLKEGRMDDHVKMIPVVSSSIQEVGYDEIENQLHVRFVTGALYAYMHVPKELFQELINAESVGKYFAEHVKKQYDFIIYSGERDDLTMKEVDPAMRIIFGDEVMNVIGEKYKVKEK
jgi:hypothetical protein